METDRNSESPKLIFLKLLTARQEREKLERTVGPPSRGEVQEPTIQRTTTGSFGGLLGRKDKDAETMLADLRTIARVLKSITFVGSPGFEERRGELGKLLRKWHGREVSSDERGEMQSELAEGARAAEQLETKIRDELEKFTLLSREAEEEQRELYGIAVSALEQASVGASSSDASLLSTMAERCKTALQTPSDFRGVIDEALSLAQAVTARTREAAERRATRVKEVRALQERVLVRLEKAVAHELYRPHEEAGRARRAFAETFEGDVGDDLDAGEARAKALGTLDNVAAEIEARNERAVSARRKLEELGGELRPTLLYVVTHGEQRDAELVARVQNAVKQAAEAKDFEGALKVLRGLKKLDDMVDRAKQAHVSALRPLCEERTDEAERLTAHERVGGNERLALNLALSGVSKAFKGGGPKEVLGALERLEAAIEGAKQAIDLDEEAEEQLQARLDLVVADFDDLVYASQLDEKLRKPLVTKMDGLGEKRRNGRWREALKHLGELRSQLKGAREKAETLDELRAERDRLRREEMARLDEALRKDETEDETARLWGEGTFRDTLLARIWRKTWSERKKGNENASIGGGPYGYQEVADAITAWNRASGDAPSPPLENVHVPRGGIQEKWTHERPRHEVQANFICTWRGRRVNIHVDVDMAQYFQLDTNWSLEEVPETLRLRYGLG